MFFWWGWDAHGNVILITCLTGVVATAAWLCSIVVTGHPLKGEIFKVLDKLKSTIVTFRGRARRDSA